MCHHLVFVLGNVGKFSCIFGVFKNCETPSLYFKAMISISKF